MFKGEALGFWYKEIGVDESTRAQTAPYEEDVGLEIAPVFVDHVRGDDGDDGIPQPVGGSRQTDTSRTDGNGEDFANDDPCTGTPGGSEEENVDTDEGDLGIDGRDIVGDWASIHGMGMIETNGVADDSHDELADEHSKGTPDEERATTESLDCPEGYRG